MNIHNVVKSQNIIAHVPALV